MSANVIRQVFFKCGLLIMAAAYASFGHAQTPPFNDDFINAEIITGDGTWFGSNIDATSEPGEPVHAVSGGASVWFQWTAAADGFLTVDTFGSNYDSTLAMYTGAAVDALTQLAANDDFGSTQSQIANVPVAAGVTYHIAVDGYLGAMGNITLNWTYWDGTDTTPPTVSVFSPIDGAEHVLNGIVLANYSCEDDFLGSGMASCIGDVPNGEAIDTSTPGAHVFEVTATDIAGNVHTEAVAYTVNGTDTTPPNILIFSPSPDDVFAVDAAISVNYDCQDEYQGTGVASCVGDLPVDAPLDTSVAGAFSFSVTATDTAGNTTTATSNYTIVESPDNDNFASPVTLSGDTGSWTGTNVGATVETGEPNHVILPSYASIWFSYTPAIDGYVTIDSIGSNFNTALAMYTGESVDALTLVFANNNGAGQQSVLPNVAVSAGVTYRIALDGYFGATGLVTLNWQFTEQYDFVPPVVTFWSPADGLVIAEGEALWAGYSCYDPVPGTGLVSCSGDVPSGTLIDTSVPGPYTFTVTAVDGQGLTTTETHSYTILASPDNDDFIDATLIDGTTGSMSGSNAGATMELSEPSHAGFISGASVWFRWTAPQDGFVSLDTLGSNFDTLLALYTGGAVNELTEIDSNDNAVGALSAIHDAPVQAGVTYSIAIAGAWDDYGDYTLNWSFQPLNDTTAPTVVIDSPVDGGMYMVGTTVLASYACIDEQLGSGLASCVGDVASGTAIDTSNAGPGTFTVTGTDNSGNTSMASVNYEVLAFSNDNFENALPISGTGGLIASNLNATKQTGEPAHAGNAGGASVWFRWTAAEDGFLSVDTLFSNFDTTLALYSGTAVDGLTELASDNDSLGQQSRVLDLSVSAGDIVYIAVDGVDGASGQIDLDWVTFTGPTFTEVTPPNDPLWVTDAEHDFWLNSAAPADVDGDGDLDLAVVGYLVEYHVGAEDRLVVFMNEGPDAQGNWMFTTQEVPLNGLISNQSDLAWGDIDGDGDPDLAVAVENATEIYRNDAGTLVPLETSLPVYSEDSNYSNAYDLRSLTFADYDNDSDLDLLIPSVYDPSTFTFRTALMRNDGPDGTGGWLFTEVDSQIDGTVHAQTAWADNDGDGDLDLFMANADNLADNGFVRTYRNDGGVFTSAEPLGNLNLDYGMADWSDYDGDGDLDILVVGQLRDVDGLYKTLLRIYVNNNGVFQPNTLIQSSFFPWLDLSAATWADYDSDGDVDILVTGSTIGEDNIEGKSEVYVNENGVFVPLGRDLPAPLDSSGSGGAFTWFDVDGDGDLDYLVAGAYWVEGGNNLIETQMHLYRNDSITQNASPQTPTGLTATPAVARAGGGASVTLSWNPASDDSTSTEALTYDLEVRADNGLPGAAASRRQPVPGSVSKATEWTIHSLAEGDYTWVVRSVDSAFNGSVDAVGSFTVGGGVDSDGDGVADSVDNCTLVANADQRDTDADGFGNACDPDLNGDGVVNFVDVALFSDVIFSADPHADFNGDGAVNFLDLSILANLFLQAPGPSGLSGGP